MKKSKSKAASSRQAAELLAAQTGGFGGGFGSGFGSAFAAGAFGAAFGGGFAQPTTDDNQQEDAASSASAADSSSDLDAWSQLMSARSREPQEVSDPQLVLALKQLSKRDPVTRLRALDSIIAHFNGMDSSAVSGVLPAWLHWYERIHLDNDRRVREATYKAFLSLLQHGARSFAPHVKMAVPLWWIHAQDPCREVARAAELCFTTAFPTKAKQVQVLRYVHREYFAYVAALWKHTPQTLSDQTVYSKEESMERWERVVASALMSVAEFIVLMAEDDKEAASSASSTSSSASAGPPALTLSSYRSILTPALWKLTSCRTCYIRRALYALCQRLVAHNPAGFVEAHMDTLAPLLLVTLLQEKERSNHQSMIDALLTLLAKFGAQAWEVMKKPASGANAPNLLQSAFYPRLQKVLETGLYGDWSGLYPTMLPLLSLMPEDIMQQVPASCLPSSPAPTSSSSSSSPLLPFYTFFFSHLWSGRRSLLSAGTAGPSPLLLVSDDFLSLVQALQDTLVYSLKKRAGDAGLVHELLHTLFLRAVLSPSLHFASARSDDPSLSPEVVEANKVGRRAFTLFGATLHMASAHLNQEQAEGMWKEVERMVKSAMQDAHGAPEAGKEDATTSEAAPVPMRRNNQFFSASAATIDSYLAAATLLTHAYKSVNDKQAETAPSPPLLQCVASVFQLGLAHFLDAPLTRLSALKQCVQLVECYSLPSILAAYPTSSIPAPTLSTFLSSSLLPVLKQLLTSAGQTSDSAALGRTFLETVELFCRGLLAPAFKALEQGGEAKEGSSTSVWEELVQLLSSSSILSPSTSLSSSSSSSQLSLLRLVFRDVLLHYPGGHSDLLQDMVVSLAERFLTCERSELFPEFIEVFKGILASGKLLEGEVLFTLLSSFLDGVMSFQQQEGDFALLARTPEEPTSSLSLPFVQKFEADTGCSIHALPSLIELLGSLLSEKSAVSLEQLAPSKEEAATFQSQLLKALFWVQFSARQNVGAAARRVWKEVIDQKALVSASASLLEIAAIFRQRLLTSPLSNFTSLFIVSWSSWLLQLYGSVPSDPSLQHRLLDAALPSHPDLQRLMAGGIDPSSEEGEPTLRPHRSLHDAAERLRVIRDLVSELSSTTEGTQVQFNERVLFLRENTDGKPRLALLLDLLALTHFLSCFEREADATAMPPHVRGNLLQVNAAEAGEELESGHLPIHQRLCTYFSSSFLTPTHLLALIDMAQSASLSSLKGDSALSSTTEGHHLFAIEASRPYTAALRWLLRLARDALFNGQVMLKGGEAVRNQLQSVLSFFLSSIPVTSIRTHHQSSALFPPFESTLVAVLESGCLVVGGGSEADQKALQATLAQLTKWSLDGLDSGMRMLAKDNKRLFALSSLVRILAALLRATTSMLQHSSLSKTVRSDLDSLFQSARSRLISLSSGLNLFDSLPTGAEGFSVEACRFMEARAGLLHAMVSCTVTLAGVDAGKVVAEVFPTSLLQHMLLWSVSVLRFASNQHLSAIRAAKLALRESSPSLSSTVLPLIPPVMAAWNFEYVAATFKGVRELMPLLVAETAEEELRSNEQLRSALHAVIAACYSMLATSSSGSSSLLRVLSVKHFTPLSVHLEFILRVYRECCPHKLVQVVREDLRPTLDESTGEVGADSLSTRNLFKLLSHPFPCIALSALSLLSIGLLERAIGVDINFEVDETEEMRHVLEASAQWQKQQGGKGRRKPSPPLEAEGEAGEEEHALALEHHRKTLRNAYRNALVERRLDQLLPHTLQRIVDERVQVNQVDVVEEQEEEEEEEDDDSLPFFSYRPVALQLRGYLLTWSLVLDLLSQKLPVSSSASSSSSSSSPSVGLSEDKSTLLLTYLRDSDAASPLLSELMEHILVSFEDVTQVERFISEKVAPYEHGHKQQEEEERQQATAAQTRVEEPAVLIEDEDEEGNVRPAAASKPAEATTSTPAASSHPPAALSEYPLWLAPCYLLSNEPAANVKVLPSATKRLFHLLRQQQQLENKKEGEAGSLLHVDTGVFFGPLSCLLYLRSLRTLPALSRNWYRSVDRASSSLIGHWTGVSFSPLLIEDEIKDVDRRQAMEGPPPEEVDEEEDQFTIRTAYQPELLRVSSKTTAATSPNSAAAVAPASVYAKFVRGEIKMGLSLKLPSSYPLQPVSVHLAEQVKLKEERSKKWALSISSILQSADGSLYDAIHLWRRNVEQHFSGVSECSICMSVVSPVNHQLPRMRCHECGNKFHSTCLYKWFQSSGNSKCPLCRTLFSA